MRRRYLRNINIMGGVEPSLAPNGVYVFDGHLCYSPKHLPQDIEPIGVACVKDNCRFFVHYAIQATHGIAWDADANINGPISGVSMCEDAASAINDFNGVKNTKIIGEYLVLYQYAAASMCYNKVVVVGNHTFVGFLPSVGEFNVFHENRQAINDIFDMMGWKNIDDWFWDDNGSTTYHALWTSTQCSASNAWISRWEWPSLYLYCDDKMNAFDSYYAFPLFPLE